MQLSMRISNVVSIFETFDCSVSHKIEKIERSKNSKTYKEVDHQLGHVNVSAFPLNFFSEYFKLKL